MNKINTNTQKTLIDDWLPKLDNLRKERKFIHHIMLGIIIFPLIIVICLIIHMILTDFNILEGSLMSIFISLSAITFVYLGKLQACDDVILQIDLAVRLGDKDFLLRSISKITCYGSFKNLINEVGRICKNETSPR
ncbi:MAG: hypothetical protein JXR31_08240 [Prolixibacteraceae bacterium]|nr:hypothetical protein [Prolixibacteraceae bacterium]